MKDRRHRCTVRSCSAAGFSLVEMLVALGLSGLLSTVLAVVWSGSARIVDTLMETQRVESELRVAIADLDAAARHAGNHGGRSATGIVPAGSNQIEIRGDRSGMVSPSRGDPDGTFAQTFEDLTFRLNPAWLASARDESAFARTALLQRRSGQGTFQPFVSGVESFEVQILDAAGQPVEDGALAESLRISLVGRSRNRGMEPPRRRVDFNLALDARHHQLFLYP